MRLRLLEATVLAVLLLGTSAQAAEPWDAAEIERPGTLFRWGYGDGGEGGPPGFDEPLASDRPDFTEASSTVGLGVVQLEMGYTYFYDSAGGASLSEHSFPEVLLRIGILADWFELRLAQNATNARLRSGGATIDRAYGFDDLYIGCKIGLTGQSGILPEMALVPQMTVPSGHPTLTNDEVLAGLNWLYGWDINETFSCAGSTQVNRALDAGTGDVYYELAQSFTVGVSFTEKLGGYAEWFVFVPTGADTEQTQHYFDGGFTYKVTNNLQLDIRGGVGLSSAAIDYFTGTGLVVRW